MKCPKCDYLGFDTGDRCKNCGYDFSLMTIPDIARDPPADRAPTSQAWLAELDEALAKPPEPAAELPVVAAIRPTLPLFTKRGNRDDDEPLIKLPVAPRAPLSVRKTPEAPRFRAVARPMRRAEAEPALRLFEEAAPDLDLVLRDDAPVPRDLKSAAAVGPQQADASTAGTRLGAVLIDHLILFAIDAAVVYFTLRMAALTTSQWQLLPPIPLVTFLVLVKLAYFFAFTAVGGQTIGKMALHIRVVTSDNAPVDAALALRRTLAGVLSSITLGLGFVPALIGSERRALHDRVAGTRVVALRSA
jgi:uncharacterized RDD family membrane protein YckC